MTDHHGPLRAGQRAPDFTLPTGPQERVRLADSRGRPTVLAFYPADWSPVCTDQMSLYQLAMPEFERHHAVVLGISVDSVWCHRAFARDRGIMFPLLADFEPKGEVARRYGVLSPGGFAARALFVLDPDQMVFWSYVSPHSVNPGADGILDALAELAARRPVSAEGGPR